MEEKWQEFKKTCSEKKDQAKGWCKEHSGELITIFGGVCTVAGAIINFCTKKYEEDSYIYTVTDKDHIYRVKCKRLESCAKSQPYEETDSIEE